MADFNGKCSTADQRHKQFHGNGSRYLGGWLWSHRNSKVLVWFCKIAGLLARRVIAWYNRNSKVLVLAIRTDGFQAKWSDGWLLKRVVAVS